MYDQSSEIIERYLKVLERRKKREPIAYIIGEQEFWSLPFHVSSDVLIPRPETEFFLIGFLRLLILKILKKGNILDLCCGSGVIATVLLKETGKMIFASDLSYRALEMCKKNARRHRSNHRHSLFRDISSLHLQRIANFPWSYPTPLM